MPNLETTYLGLQLKNPLIVSASPLSRKVDRVRRLEQAGAGAIIMYSLFEEQIDHESRSLDHYLSRGTDSYAESLSYFPDLQHYNLEPEQYINHLKRLKDAVQIPVIASLNGISSGGWIEYAHRLQEAGADALELNIYFVPTDPNLTGMELEESFVTLVSTVREQLTIPLAVKIGPSFTSVPNMAQRFAAAGANGLVLFNRFYQPDLDLDEFEVVPSLHLSTSEDLRIPLRWIAILYGQIAADLALTSGVHSAQDAIKGIMAGASAVMMASELLSKGTARLGEILYDMHAWMIEHEYVSAEQMRGSMSQRAVAQPAAFERANYLKVLNSFDDRMLV
jgi:dihydroorotate dehydrogenase (fumarate)